MTNQIFATWMLSNNIGDALTPWLIEKITGQMPFYVTFESQYPKYMVTGSILNHAVKYTTVWGAGIADISDSICGDVDVRLVRGPLTARQARFQSGIDIVACGDPTLILPLLVNPRNNDRTGLSEQFKVGMCPHYVHQREVCEWVGDNRQIKILNVFDRPEKFVKDIVHCDVIYSSSLHGLIIADAYGIPSMWFEGTVKLGGDGTKFYDHLLLKKVLTDEPPESAMGVLDGIIITAMDITKYVKTIKPVHLHQLPKDADKLREMIIDKPKPCQAVLKALQDRIIETCPFKVEINGKSDTDNTNSDNS